MDKRYFCLYMNKIFFVLLFLPMLANAQEKLTESNYRIYSVKAGKEVALKDIVADMHDHDVLLYGEEHNDSVTHFLEKSILELLYAQYKNQVTLSLEMFERDVQPVMNEYLKGFIREKHCPRNQKNFLHPYPMTLQPVNITTSLPAYPHIHLQQPLRL
jgi:uncharacterized iron-regulated protein